MVEARPAAGAIQNTEGWLFRIVHNTALDFLRRRSRQEALRSAEEVETMADPIDEILRRQIAATSLRTFMRLPLAQRACVILADVLGCSLQEVCEVVDYSLPAVKAALNRGRTRLREWAEEADDAPRPQLSHADRERLSAYVASFNARDFDAIRAMIADDVKLELVNKTRLNGKAEFPAISATTTRSQTGIWCRLCWKAARRSWCSTRTSRTPARNISCWWTGRPARSRPSAISATPLTWSTVPSTKSDRFPPTGSDERSLGNRHYISCFYRNLRIMVQADAHPAGLSRRFYGPKPAWCLLAVGDFAHKTAP
ncbi:sigma factor-like helix-turn-helix DNA-binding protein [Bradyrhizobium sp.]|uniref:sigma factor-like helix-turn-helix DNA-binding protein n=1 Tax=Bradyrhizobium sp. TaxID=376 RepID=UPI0025C1736D|nr:sigma factor-like helix-turn-helix DNA-binding protein [Bradyrhizobium sp.]